MGESGGTSKSEESIEKIPYNLELVNDICDTIMEGIREFGLEYRERARQLLREKGYADPEFKG